MKSYRKILLALCASWGTLLAGVTPDWVQPVTMSEKGKTETGITVPAMPELYGYQVVLRAELPELKQAAALTIKVNGQLLSAMDAESVSRIRTPDTARMSGEGKVEILPGKARRVLEITLNGSCNAEKENKIEFSEVLAPEDQNGSGLLASAKFLMRPEGPSAAQLPPGVEAGALAIVPGPELKVLYRGKTLFADDDMVGLGKLAELKAESHVEKTSDGKITAENILVHHEVADFRREAAIDKDGALELSIRTAYKKEFPGNYMWYSFAMPAEFFDGAKWETRSGSAGGFDLKQGTVDLAAIPENGRLFSHDEIRFLHLEKGDVKLNFDFNPYGSGDWYGKVPYAGNPIGCIALICKVGNTVRFNITKRPGADRYAAKVRIYAGETDFAFRHYNNAASYYVGPFIGNPGLRLLFGTPESTAKRNAAMSVSSRSDLFSTIPFQSMEKQSYLPLLSAGWKNCPDNVKSYADKKALFPIASGMAANGNAEAEFAVPALPGVYNFQLTMGHPAMAQGPFSVTLNGELLADNITLKAGEYRQLFAAVYLKDPVREAVVKFSGKNWSLNQLIWRNSASEAEDLCLARKFWNVPDLADFGLRPNVWQTIPDQSPEIPVILGKELTPAWQVRPALAGKAPELPDDTLPPLAEDDPALAWVWNLNMTFLSLGLGNAESGFGFTDEAFLRQRLAELKAKGFNAITEQGLFWHASYSDESFQGFIEHQKRVNKIIHEYGIKVIRHVDGPSFCLMADGLANFARFPGAFGQHFDSMQGFQGIGCINNPLLREWVIHRIGDYVAATDADGVMVDECAIAERVQCGCVHCRKKFLEDTGCVLPMPGDKSVDFSDQSPLHARFVEWKLRCNAEFHRAVKTYVNQVRPGTLVTAYDIDRELSDGGGRTGYRADYFAPRTDFFGSEPCSINLFVNYRCYLANRKLMLAFSRETGHPVWTLIYTWGIKDASQAGMLGWMLAAATSHSLWLEHSMAHPVMAWKGAADRRNQESMADVAILYCPDARFFVGYAEYQPYMEAAGISQSLSDHHITHDFITRRDLLRKPVLDRYKVLVLGCANILSNAEMAALTRWVQDGGKLLISGTFAEVDENYLPRKPETVTTLTGVRSANEFQELKVQTVAANGTTLTMPPRFVPMTLAGAEAKLKFADGTPLLARKAYGKGEVWRSAIPLGESNYEKIFYRAQAYTFSYNEALAKLVPEMLSFVHPEAFRTAVAGNVPKEQIIEFYRDKTTQDVFIHCINLSGSNRVEVGKAPDNTRLPDDAFQHAADMQIEVAGEFASAVVTSPDFEGEIVLPMTSKAGRTVFTLPGKNLQHYALIVLKK